MLRKRLITCATLLTVVVTGSFGDETFNGLIASEKYQEAIEYADQKIPSTSRDAATSRVIGHERADALSRAVVVSRR